LVNGLRYLTSRTLDGHYIGVREFLRYVSGETVSFLSDGEHGRDVEAIMEEIIHQVRGNT
jgi:hypothetical protein